MCDVTVSAEIPHCCPSWLSLQYSAQHHHHHCASVSPYLRKHKLCQNCDMTQMEIRVAAFSGLINLVIILLLLFQNILS